VSGRDTDPIDEKSPPPDVDCACAAS
jgi:hypothetical protein